MKEERWKLPKKKNIREQGTPRGSEECKIIPSLYPKNTHIHQNERIFFWLVRICIRVTSNYYKKETREEKRKV